MTYYRRGSAGSRLSVGDLRRADIEGASILHVSGITLGLSKAALDAVELAVTWAEGAGVPISFDLNHRESIWGTRDPKNIYRRLLRSASIVFAGSKEASMLVGAATPAELATTIAKEGPSEVIVKMGQEGCTAVVDGSDHSHVGFAVQVVDTVGAGDAFAAGYLAERLRGKSVDERLATATMAGACACLSLGDWEGYPTQADLEVLNELDLVYGECGRSMY